MSDTAQWITLLTLVAGFAYQIYTAQRDRKWALADRKELAEKVVTEAAKVATKVTTEAATAARTTAAHVRQLSEDIAANTEISTKAFHEANSVNLKIANLGLEHNALQREKQEDKQS